MATATESPLSLQIAGLAISCGPLGEAECRSVVSAFGSLAKGATAAQIGAPACDGQNCQTPPPSDLVVGVVVRWGEGDLSKVLTCTRATPGAAIRCERAPVDLG
jgi:hypothetical protein